MCGLLCGLCGLAYTRASLELKAIYKWALNRPPSTGPLSTLGDQKFIAVMFFAIVQPKRCSLHFHLNIPLFKYVCIYLCACVCNLVHMLVCGREKEMSWSGGNIVLHF